jgi:hypothetical protein
VARLDGFQSDLAMRHCDVRGFLGSTQDWSMGDGSPMTTASQSVNSLEPRVFEVEEKIYRTVRESLSHGAKVY